MLPSVFPAGGFQLTECSALAPAGGLNHWPRRRRPANQWKPLQVSQIVPMSSNKNAPPRIRRVAAVDNDSDPESISDWTDDTKVSFQLDTFPCGVDPAGRFGAGHSNDQRRRDFFFLQVANGCVTILNLYPELTAGSQRERNRRRHLAACGPAAARSAQHPRASMSESWPKEGIKASPRERERERDCWELVTRFSNQ